MGVDDSKAGALGMCPGCKATFRIPIPDRPGIPASPSEDATRIAPIPRPVPARPMPVQPAPPPATYQDDYSAYAVELEAEPPPTAQKRVPSIAEQYEPDDDDLAAPRRRRRRGDDEGGVWTGDLIPGLSNFVLIMIILGLGWIVLGGVTMLWAPAGFLLIGIGSLVGFVSGIWMLKIAFEDGTGTGLAFMFVPFYGFMYIFSNLDRLGVPFLISLVGNGYVITGVVTMMMHH